MDHDTGPSVAKEPTDEALLRRFFQQGDRAAVGVFFQRHAGRAYRLALCIAGDPHAAEEAVQSAFVRVLAQKDAAPQNPRAWLSSIVVNACRADARAAKRRRVREESFAMEQPTRTTPTASASETAELLEAALRTVKGLPEHYRLPLWLHFVENLSFADAAATLGLSEGTVREQTRRGLAHVRETLTTAGLSAAALRLPELLHAAPVPPAPVSLVKALSAAQHGASLSSATAVATKAGAATLAKAGLAATVLLTGAAVAALVIHSRPHETHGDAAPPAPVVIPKVAPAGAASVAAPAATALDAILNRKLNATFRRDYPYEVLRTLHERTG